MCLGLGGSAPWMWPCTFHAGTGRRFSGPGSRRAEMGCRWREAERGSAQRGERRGRQSANTGRGAAGSGVHGIRGATPPMTTRVVRGRLRRPRRGGVAVETLTRGKTTLSAEDARGSEREPRAELGQPSVEPRPAAGGCARIAGPVHNSIRGGEVSEQSTSFRGMHAQRPRPPPWRYSYLARCGA